MIFRDLGQKGEYLARLFLEKKGYEFVRANFQSKKGEIDLIFIHDDDIVFVEVKTRRLHSAKKYGRGMEQIDARKRENILRCSADFLREERKLCAGLTPRYDTVEIYVEDLSSTQVKVLHSPYAFGI